jgi:hypothetical protein
MIPELNKQHQDFRELTLLLGDPGQQSDLLQEGSRTIVIGISANLPFAQHFGIP